MVDNLSPVLLQETWRRLAEIKKSGPESQEVLWTDLLLSSTSHSGGQLLVQLLRKEFEGGEGDVSESLRLAVEQLELVDLWENSLLTPT